MVTILSPQSDLWSQRCPPISTAAPSSASSPAPPRRRSPPARPTIRRKPSPPGAARTAPPTCAAGPSATPSSRPTRTTASRGWSTCARRTRSSCGSIASACCPRPIRGSARSSSARAPSSRPWCWRCASAGSSPTSPSFPKASSRRAPSTIGRWPASPGPRRRHRRRDPLFDQLLRGIPPRSTTTPPGRSRPRRSSACAARWSTRTCASARPSSRRGSRRCARSAGKRPRSS